MVLLSVAALEIGLGFGTALLYKLRLSSSETLFARDYVRPHYDWHPLLQVRQVPTAVARSTRDVAYVNASGGAAASAIRRTQEQVRRRPDRRIDDARHPLARRRDLGRAPRTAARRRPLRVINHGVSGYTTSEHVIQTAFYQDSFGVPANCAVYYIGWNDHPECPRPRPRPGLCHQSSGRPDRRPRRPAYQRSRPLGLADPVLPGKLAILAFDTVRPPAPVRSDGGKGPDPALEKIYARNIATISAINRGRGIRTVWIGQVMNKAGLKDDQMEDGSRSSVTPRFQP